MLSENDRMISEQTGFADGMVNYFVNITKKLGLK